MTKYILTDVDDTILNFTFPFQNWAEKKGFSLNGCMRVNTSGGICTLLDIDRDEADRLVTEFTLETEDFANLPPEPDALEILPRLHRAGYEFIAITATIENDFNRNRRVANLKKAFGFDFHTVTLSGLGVSKLDALTAHEPTIWVEDNFGHAVTGTVVGHTSHILTRSYNAHESHPEVIRVNDWHEIAEGLL